MRARASSLLICACALTAALVGCGGSGERARALLNEAFSHPIGSASILLEASATLNGSGPFRLEASGPYQSNGPKRLPSFQLALSIVGGGRSFTGGVTSTGDDAYVTLAGASYDIGTQQVARANAQLANGNGRSLASLGLDPKRWVRDASVEGSAQVGGTATTHVHANVDVGALLTDLRRTVSSAGGSLAALSDRQIGAVGGAIQSPALDVYVSKSDGTLRRVALTLSFDAPGARASRLRSGTLSVSLELADVGRPVSIQAPPNPQPLTALSGSFGGGSAGAQAPSPQKLQAYSQCLRSAGTTAAALARCAALLR